MKEVTVTFTEKELTITLGIVIRYLEVGLRTPISPEGTDKAIKSTEDLARKFGTPEWDDLTPGERAIAKMYIALDED